jgi:ribosome-binding protein aMBF1 (putative translation factor)
MSNNETKGWLASNMEDPEFRRLLEREEIIEDFLNHVDEEMKKQGVSRSELARRMDCKPANITQIMRRTRNLTVATMVDIAFFLGLKLKLSITMTESVAEELMAAIYTISDWKERLEERSAIPFQQDTEVTQTVISPDTPENFSTSSSTKKVA